IQKLAKQEGTNYKDLSLQDYTELITSPVTRLFVARLSSSQIVGMATLVVYRIPYVRKAYLEDIVVDEAFRGQGIGTRLIETVIAEAKRSHASYLDFTSRPRRAEGNSLYQKMGFEKRDSHVYRLLIDYGEV
ncbi:MAG TPA: GNAT family N-acetyltransferase, partial [Patescibacteria group bacterium]|nr:GNAT family N-acetyltransferase [Patescibacteria group bacterium]